MGATTSVYTAGTHPDDSTAVAATAAVVRPTRIQVDAVVVVVRFCDESNIVLLLVE
jgi:hypothetical protein